MFTYLVEVGILLSVEDEEYNCYNHVYDKKHGYYDEDQYYVKDKTEAIKNAKTYVENGVENTYAVVSITVVPDDYDFEDGYVFDEFYHLNDVEYSVAKINGKIIENFIIRPINNPLLDKWCCNHDMTYFIDNENRHCLCNTDWIARFDTEQELLEYIKE